MWAVLFEVTPKPDRWDAYFAHAAALRPELVRIEGFLDNRRFASRTRPGTLLSLSYWQHEAALIQWRSHAPHREVQAAGRHGIFDDYRLRVGEVSAEPAGRSVTILENLSPATPPEGADWDMFDGVTVPGATLLLLTWHDAGSLATWSATAGSSTAGTQRTDIAVRRDYGMRDREQAPRHFPPVARD